MLTTSSSRRVRAAAAVAVTLVATALSPAVALAHAELDSASPADGAVLDTPPTEIVLTYTEALDPDSHLELVGPDGTEIARTGVDPNDDRAMRIDPPELGPGAYQVLSTAIAAHDGAVDRETLTFTIFEPTPSPTATPTEAPSATPSPPPTASPVSPSPSPTPSPAADGSADVIIPILVAIVVVAALGGWLLSRSRGRGPA